MKHQSKVELSSLRRKIQSYLLFAFQAPLVCILTLLLEEVNKKVEEDNWIEQSTLVTLAEFSRLITRHWVLPSIKMFLPLCEFWILR